MELSSFAKAAQGTATGQLRQIFLWSYSVPAQGIDDGANDGVASMTVWRLPDSHEPLGRTENSDF
jgi:hypothetical protein